MTERRLTFIDVDENQLVVWLKEDRIQLVVVDSRPELEAGELRGFAVALFATYVGAPLAARLDSARRKIGGVRDKLATTAGVDELIAALDGSLNAIEDVKHVITAAGTVIAPDPEPVAPPPAAPTEPATRARATADGRSGKPRSARRAGEGGAAPGWGWSGRPRCAARSPRAIARPSRVSS
jgi:hypothetical protein